MPAIGTETGKKADAPKRKVVGRVKPPAAKQVTQARAQEQTYKSQAHSVRLRARDKTTQQRGTSPVGDRPQGRAGEMDAAILHVGPGGTGKKLRPPELPRGAQQRGTSPVGDRPQGRAQEMRAAPTVARVKKKTGGGGPMMAVVHLPKNYISAITNSDASASGLDIAGNAVKDASELAVTMPSSVAKFASAANRDAVTIANMGNSGHSLKETAHSLKTPGLLAGPYKQLAKDPAKAVSEHPVSTALMVAPAVRMPGRVVGKIARVMKKQTLERPAASLPHTAVKDARTGSRDAVVRAVQSRHDKKNPAPVMTVKDVQMRVDEHYDLGKHLAQRTEKAAVRAAHQTVKDLPKAQRKQARGHVVQHARDTAREQAKADAEARFAQEFGATGRLSTGAAERDAARAARVTAVGHVETAKVAHVAAKAQHDQAVTAARTARAKAQKSSKLSSLEAQRTAAVKGLVSVRRAQSAAERAHAEATTAARIAATKPTRTPKIAALESRRRKLVSEKNAAEKAHADAMAEFGVARGRAEVLSRNVAGTAGERRAQAPTVPVGTPQYAGGGHGVRISAEGLQAATKRVNDAHAAIQQVDRALAAERKRVQGVPPAQHDALLRAINARAQVPVRVRDARARVRDLDQQIAAETQRIRGVPPAEHTALVRAIDTRAQTQAALAAARTQAEGARATHIAVKQAMRTATVTDHAPAGRIFDHQADAQLVARKLNETATPIATGGVSPVRLVVHEPGPGRPVSAARSTNTEPLTFTVRKIGDQYAVLPKVAANRMYPSGEAGAKLSHQSVGSSPSTMAKVMRRSRGAFTQAVLPFSLKWLGGQASEAAVRALIAGAGPFDWLRMDKTVKKMNAHQAGSGDEYMMRMTGGQFELTGAARDFAEGKSLAAEFQGTALNQPAAAATMVGHALPIRAVRAGFRGYSRTVIGAVNGAIEHNARKAMAGQAIKNSPLMEHHLLGLMDGAITDAARGLRETPAQIATSRAVDKMYGKYSKFSPEMRSLLLHWTPFLPWFINSAYFLAVHLPKDHPVQTALLADISMATEDWRKSHDLSLRQANHVPLWMMGGYPKKGGGYYNLGHYFPTGAASQVASSTGGLVLPQMIGPIENLKGIDWKGKRLVDSHGNEFTQGQDALRALVTAVEGQVPGARQAGALSGVTPRYVDRTAPEKIPSAGTVLKKMLPWAPIGGGAAPVSSSGGVTGRVKLPSGVTGRVKVPGGATGRVKVPGG